MKKLFVALSAIALLTFGLSAMADNSSNFRVGVLDMHKIMTDSPQVQNIKDSLQKQFKPKEDQLNKQRDALNADAEKLRKESTILSNNDRDALQKKVVEEQRNLQKDAIAFQQDANRAQNAAFKQLIDKVKTISQNIAKREKLNVVITSDVALYFDNQLDITEFVLSDLKKANG